MKKVYLAGAMHNTPDASLWRMSAAIMLPDDWEAVDPCKLESAGMSPQEIVTLDYGWILQCKSIIARVAKPCLGTAMELGYARLNNIPVIGWSNTIADSNWPLSPWLLAHTKVIHRTLKQAIGELQNVE